LFQRDQSYRYATHYFTNPSFAWVAGALYGVTPDFTAVAQALNSVAQGNWGFIASAMAGGISLYLSDIAQALSGAGANLPTIAGALWTTGVAQYFNGFQISNVAYALFQVQHDWTSVAHALVDAGIMSWDAAAALVGLNGGGGIVGGIIKSIFG
jgi:hypothetical protein